MKDDLILQTKTGGEDDRSIQFTTDTGEPLGQIQPCKHTIEIGRSGDKSLGFFHRRRNGFGLAIKGEHQSAARDVPAEIKHDTPRARIDLVQIGRNRVGQRDLHFANMILGDGVALRCRLVARIERIRDRRDRTAGFRSSNPHCDICACGEGRIVQPEYPRPKASPRRRRMFHARDHVAARNEQFPIERDADRLPGAGLARLSSTVARPCLDAAHDRAFA